MFEVGVVTEKVPVAHVKCRACIKRQVVIFHWPGMGTTGTILCVCPLRVYVSPNSAQMNGEKEVMVPTSSPLWPREWSGYTSTRVG